MVSSQVWLDRALGLDAALTGVTRSYSELLAEGPMKLQSGAHANKFEKLWHGQLRRMQETRSKIKKDLDMCIGAYCIALISEGDDDQF